MCRSSSPKVSLARPLASSSPGSCSRSASGAACSGCGGATRTHCQFDHRRKIDRVLSCAEGPSPPLAALQLRSKHCGSCLSITSTSIRAEKMWSSPTRPRSFKRNGHDVIVATVSNRSIAGAIGQLKTALYMASSPFGSDWMHQQLTAVRPDVVHVHNFFPLLSPSIYAVCNAARFPLFRPCTTIGPSAPTPCSPAIMNHVSCASTGSPYQGVRYRCYRGSAVATLPLARMIAMHRAAGTWHHRVDRFIALTEFARSRFLAAGFPADKVVAKPNFVADPGLPASAGEGGLRPVCGQAGGGKGHRDADAAHGRRWRCLSSSLATGRCARSSRHPPRRM